MPYPVPTAAEFRVRFPSFAAVLDAPITAALSECKGRASQSWDEADYRLGVMLLAAHSLTLDGFGASVETQLKDFESIGVGSIKLAIRTPDGRAGVLTATSFGNRFVELAARCGGPAVFTA